MLKVVEHCGDVVQQLVLLNLAGFLRGVCLCLRGLGTGQGAVTAHLGAREKVPKSAGKELTWLFHAFQDRGLPGKLEPVSPVSPAHPDTELDLLPARLSKEELIQNMDRVDREITMVEQQISKLKKKQVRGCGLEGIMHPCFCVLPHTPSLLVHVHRGEGAVPVPPGWSVSALPVVSWSGYCCPSSLELVAAR